MNRANEVIDYLSKSDNPDTLIIAPSAPPVSRTGREIGVAMATVFDSQDVNDTLGAFRTRALAAAGETAMSKAGTFSFGIKEVGRFRVNYATQRGSRIMTIVRIPHSIPKPSDLCTDCRGVEKAVSLMTSGGAGFITIGGPSAINNAVFAYALLQEINHASHKLIYIMERTLTFLMKHENSIAIQCELHVDAASMEDGINGAALFDPDIVYVGDIRPGDQLSGIARSVENGAMALLSSVLLSEQELIKRYCTVEARPGPDEMISAGFRVKPDKHGKLAVDMFENILGE